MTTVATVCTWEPDCPDDGAHRMERKGQAVSLVEFVCTTHIEPARAEGYELTTETTPGGRS